MNKRIAVITGASSGIGRELAIRFASCGWNLVLTYNTNKRGITSLKKKLGDSVIDIEKLNLADELSINNFVKSLEEKVEKVNLLINNAGIGSDQISFLDTNYENISTLINSNLTGGMYLTKSIYLKFWKENRGLFRVINTSSIRGIEYGGGGCYCL